MLCLHHHTFCPMSRAVRVITLEKGLDCEMRDGEDQTALAFTPPGDIPVLVENETLRVCGGRVIMEYLEEAYPDVALLPRGIAARAEVRRLVDWFAGKFTTEVCKPLVDEKLIKRLRGGKMPDSRAVRTGRANIHSHLQYVGWLNERRRWLAGDMMTLADLTAAAHLSLVDYTSDILWDDHPEAKDWYTRIKCRPSFRPLLDDVIAGVPPPRHYRDLDF